MLQKLLVSQEKLLGQVKVLVECRNLWFQTVSVPAAARDFRGEKWAHRHGGSPVFEALAYHF